MGNTKKRIAVLAAAVVTVSAIFTGCSSTLDKDATVMTVGEEKVPLGVANFYARYQQVMTESSYASYLGDSMWTTAVDDEGTTLEDSTKDTILEDVKKMYVLEDHMKDYNIEITEDEKSKIEEAAKEFVKANDADDLEMISGDEETIGRVMELLTIQKKMREAMVADVDQNVSDEEAAQKSMQYVSFSFTKTADDGTTSTMTDEEKAELKKTAEEFLKGAKTAEDFEAYAEEAGYTAVTNTFDAEDTTPSADLIAAADKLKEGEFTDLIETDSGYYIAKVTSLLDREATDTEKESIISQRESERYAELAEGFVEDADISVEKKVWEKVSFTKQKVSVKQTESGEDTGDTDNTEDTGNTEE